MINSPPLFSICVVNDSLTDEIQVFREHTNVFQEYMFTFFYFQPMNLEQLKELPATDRRGLQMIDDQFASALEALKEEVATQLLEEFDEFITKLL